MAIDIRHIVEVRKVKTEPLEKQIAFLLGRKVGSWRDIEHELGSDKFRLIDALFFLSGREFEEYYANTGKIEELLQKGVDLLKIPDFWVAKDSVFVDYVKKRRRAFLEEVLAQFHQKEFGMVFDNYVSKLASKELTYEEAKHLASRGESLPAAVGGGWSSGFDEYNDRVAAAIRNDFEAHLPAELSGDLSCHPTWWYFPLLTMKYGYAGIDYIDFKADLHVVADVEVKLWAGKHYWMVAGVGYSKNLEEAQLGHYAKVFSPAELKIGRIQLIRVPLRLVQGLCDGELEPEGSYIISRQKNVVYAVDGYAEHVVLSDAFLEWLRSWAGRRGWVGLIQTLRRAGSLDGITYEILKKRIKEPLKSTVSLAVSSAVSHAVKTSDKDLRKLDMMYRANVSEPLTYAEWAKLLGMNSRQGADAWLHRMQKQGNLTLKRTSRGTKATLAELAKNSLKAMPPSRRKPRK